MRRLVALFALVLAIVPASAALAQPAGTPNPFEVKFVLGFGGEADLDGDVSGDDDLILTLGLALEYDYFVLQWLALGGLIQASWWNTDEADDNDFGRNFFFDLAFVPKAAYQVSDGFYLHGALPIGLAFSSINDDFEGEGVDVDLGIGLFVQLLVGIQVELSSAVNLLVELGYTYHSVAHEGTLQGFGGDADFDLTTGQFTLNLGLAF